MTAIFQFVIFYPPSAVMTNNQSYVDVLTTAPRLVLFGTLAMFAGDIANNYVLAKMKVWTNGRYISERVVLSTLCGQTVNTAVFYAFALWRIMPRNALSRSIIVAKGIGAKQGFVSKYETGERRLDFLDLLAICDVLTISIIKFAERFESARKSNF
jgi:uncharacterized PurR-regulated membrane protein YhhQ (DUF165 family)